MLSSEQLKLRTKLEKSIEKATFVLSNFIENGEASRKKYAWILRDRLSKCHVRLTYEDMRNDAIVSEARRTLSCAAAWLKSSSNQTPVLRRKFKTEQRDSLSVPGGDGSGMYAFKFGMQISSATDFRTQALFQNAGQCENEAQRMTPITKKFYFANRNEALRLKNAVLHFGLHYVIEHDSERYYLIRQDDTASQTMTVLIFHMFPLRSYKINQSRLQFNEVSINKLRRVKSVSSAIEFLDDFGSHVALDLNQLGGLLCHSLEITAPQAQSASILERYADEIVNERLTQLKFQPDGFFEVLRNSEEGTEVECRYELETLGPVVAQPMLFEQLLEANPFDLPTIDRDFLSLVGVWEIIEQRNPTLKTQADLLRQAWLEKAADSQGPVVEREIKKVRAALKLNVNKKLQSAINGRATDCEKTVSSEISSVKSEKRAVPIEKSKTEPKVTKEDKQDKCNDTAQSTPRQDPQVTSEVSSVKSEKHALPIEKPKKEPAITKEEKKDKSNDTAQSKLREDPQVTSERVPEGRKRFSSVVAVEVHRESGEQKNRKPSKEFKVLPPKEEIPKIQSTQSDVGLGSNQSPLEPLSLQGKEVNKEHQSVVIENAEASPQPPSNTKPDEGIKEEQVVLLVETPKLYFAEPVFITEHGSNEEFESEHTVKSVKEIINEINRTIFGNQSDAFKRPPVKRSNFAQSTLASELDDGASEAQRIINATINLSVDGASSANKKLYSNYFIADYPYYTTDPKARMLMSVRRRKIDNGTSASVYNTLLEMLSEIDAPSIRETFSLLLENNYLIPLFNPLTKQNYAEIFKDISFRLAPLKPTSVRLGSDKTLSRVAIISARKDNQAEELIRSLFEVQTFHHDAASGSPNGVTIDFGIAQMKQNGLPSKHWVLLSYITGDFKQAIEYVREFTDHLIVEHCPDDEETVHEWVQRCWRDKQNRKSAPNDRSPLADIPHVTFWTPTLDGLFWTAPKDNFHVFGPDPLMIESPLNDKLLNLLARILKFTFNKDVEEKSYKPASNRKSLREVTILKGALPLEGLPDSDVLTRHLNKLNIRQSLPLQRIFREVNGLQHNSGLSKDSNILMQHLDIELQLNVTLSMNIPLVDVYLRSLHIADPSKRIHVLRLIEEALFAKTEEELLFLGEEIVRLHASYIDHLKSVKSPTETAFALKKYIEAKQNYRHLALYAKHLWREISLAYFIKPYAFSHLPALAAQYVLDGFKLELFQDETVNVNWIHAVLFELAKKVQQEKQRFFVVSCIGQQNRKKSSLLANLFGRSGRNEGSEHYNTGVFMQILPVMQRDEYDYILVLDAEDCWQPSRYEALHATQQNYQIATLCSLISDAIILVNPREADIVDTDILWKVFAASEDSLRCQWSSKRSIFSVYNWIENRRPNLGAQSFRVIEWPYNGQVGMKNVEEITCMAKFRELIHGNVMEPRDGVLWKSRDLSTIEKQISETWEYACSIDFPVLLQNTASKQMETAVPHQNTTSKVSKQSETAV